MRFRRVLQIIRCPVGNVAALSVHKRSTLAFAARALALPPPPPEDAPTGATQLERSLYRLTLSEKESREEGIGGCSFYRACGSAGTRGSSASRTRGRASRTTCPVRRCVISWNWRGTTRRAGRESVCRRPKLFKLVLTRQGHAGKGLVALDREPRHFRPEELGVCGAPALTGRASPTIGGTRTSVGATSSPRCLLRNCGRSRRRRRGVGTVRTATVRGARRSPCVCVCVCVAASWVF